MNNKSILFEEISHMDKNRKEDIKQDPARVIYR
jgi:hypothetical protein